MYTSKYGLAPPLLSRPVLMQVDVQEAWSRVSAGECLYHMATTNILSYCVFDAMIDIANETARAAVEAEMASSLNGTNANATVVTSSAVGATWFEGRDETCELALLPCWKEALQVAVSISFAYYSLRKGLCAYRHFSRELTVLRPESPLCRATPRPQENELHSYVLVLLFATRLSLPFNADLFADVLTAKGFIGGFGLGVSVLVGTVYLLFLRIPGVLFLLIWGLLFAVWAILAGSGGMLLQTAEAWAAEEEPRVHDDGQVNAAKYLSYVMFGETLTRLRRGGLFFKYFRMVWGAEAGAGVEATLGGG